MTKRNILVFLWEVGAVDNRVYRQFAGCDTLKASAKFSMMRDAGLLEMKGWGKVTYPVGVTLRATEKSYWINPVGTLIYIR